METISKGDLLYLIKMTREALKDNVNTDIGGDIALGLIVSALIDDSD